MDHNDIRKAFRAADDVRDAGLAEPEDVVRQRDIPYGPYGKWNLLDVYRPEAAGDAALPVIVSVHGGGWVYGDKERYRFYCMDLSRRGFAVVNYNYRLAPEHRFPAAVEDTNRVFCWLADHGAAYGMDLKRLFVVGDSAGAQLACQYLAMLTDPSFGALYDLALPSDLIRVRGAALNCGHYRFRPESRWQASDYATVGSYFGPDPDRYLPMVDALGHITPAFPPAFVMTSWYDFLRDQAQPLCDRLRDQGVPFVYRLYGREGQRYMGHVFHLNIRLQEAEQCNREETDFFRAQME